MDLPLYTASGVGCAACPALTCSRTQIVDGVGSSHPKVLFIAEAPGEHEDSSGIPFIGKSGQLLRSTASAAGLDYRDVHFTNAVRCRPVGNRTPTDEEVRACSGWLDLELARLQPQHVVLLGATARRAWAIVGPESGVPEDRVHRLAHPAAVMRNPKLRPGWEVGIERIVGSAVGRVPTDAAVPIVGGWVEGEPDWDSPWIAADTETKELENEVHGNELVCIQVSDGQRSALYLPHQRPHLASVYLHNAKYDANALGIDLRDFDRWDDTALMAYVLRDQPVGLKDLGPRLTGLQMRPISEILTGYDYEEKRVRLTARGLPESSTNVEILHAPGDSHYIRRTRKKRGRNFAEALEESPEEARTYALLDAVVTSRLAEILHPRLAAEPKLLRYYNDIEKPVVPILYDAEQAGITVNPDALTLVAADLDEQLVFHVDTAKTILNVPDTWNINSGRQVAHALKELGVELRNTTKTGETSVGAAELLEAVGFPTVDELEHEAHTPARQAVLHILRHREVVKLRKTYVTRLLEDRDSNSRVHGSFNQMVANTNRLSSSDPNLQNIPVRTTTGARIRSSFIAKPDHILMKADFSALELRIFTHYINDPGMRSAFEAGLNPHDLNAERWKIPRSRAKNFIFGTAYGMEERKAAIVAGVPESEAAGFLHQVRAETPGLLTWPVTIANQLMSKGYLENLLGWRNYYPGFWSPLKSEQSKALREAGNFPIQSTASSIVKTFMIALDQITAKYDSVQLLQVHDEVVLEVPKKAVQELAVVVDGIARDIGAQVLSVPLEVEIKLGPSWQGGKVWKSQRQ